MAEQWEPPTDIPVWVVCAANRLPGTKLIFCGARHFDEVMRGQIKQACLTLPQVHSLEQGFIDQWGRFMTREEAMIAVKKSGQPFDAKSNGGSETVLYSEGLY